MSSIVINFPDCARLGSHEDSNLPDDMHDTITVTTENCPAQGDTYTDTLFSTWQFILMAVIVLAVVVATGIVRFRRHERLEAERKAELDADVAKSSVKHVSCPTCGDRYAREEK